MFFVSAQMGFNKRLNIFPSILEPFLQKRLTVGLVAVFIQKLGRPSE